jgi:hypothetical protein
MTLIWHLSPAKERLYESAHSLDPDAMLVCAYDDNESSSRTTCRGRFRWISSSRRPTRYVKTGRSFSIALDRRKQHRPVGQMSIERRASRMSRRSKAVSTPGKRLVTQSSRQPHRMFVEIDVIAVVPG